MASSSAALAMREAFGDRRLPEISRRITACVNCRKVKIKCHMKDSGPPCERCAARNLDCNVNKSLQMILENDVSWKTDMQQRVEKLEEHMLHKLDNNDDKAPGLTTDGGNRNSDGQPTQSSTAKPATNVTARSTPEPTLNLDFSLGAFPGSSLTSPAAVQSPATAIESTQVAIVPYNERQAQVMQEHFDFFIQNLDYYLPYIFEEDDTAAIVANRSRILILAICAVSSTYRAAADQKSFVEAFKQEVSTKLFAITYTFDDVRALCIGAIWLKDISAVLNGLAVRIATQLELHRCITKMPHEKRLCYNRTRLYYLVYVCDHHCSLIFGRPPLTQDFFSLCDPTVFLQSTFPTRVDNRLIAQVKLWAIGRHVFDCFGADVESPLVKERADAFARLKSMYDLWFAEWHTIMVHAEPVGSRVRFTSDLSPHCALLALFSHAFRGRSESMTLWIDMAVQSALQIARRVSNDSAAALRLTQIPTYFQMMIAYAIVLLARYSSGTSILGTIPRSEAKDEVKRIVQVIQSTQFNTGSSFLRNVANALPQQDSSATLLGSTAQGGDVPDPVAEQQSTNNEYEFLADVNFQNDIFSDLPSFMTSFDSTLLAFDLGHFANFH